MVQQQGNNQITSLKEGIVCTYSPDGRIIFSNDAFSTAFITSEKPNWFSMLVDDDKALLMNLSASLSLERPIAEVVCRLHHREKKTVWYHLNLKAFFNGEGIVQEFYVTGHAIEGGLQHKKAVEHAVPAPHSKKSYATLLESVLERHPGFVFLIDLNNKTNQFYNKNIYESLGYSFNPEKSFLQYAESIVYPVDHELWEKAWENIKAGRVYEQLVFRAVHINSVIYWFHAEMFSIPSEKDTESNRVLMIMTDVSHQTKKEKQKNLLDRSLWKVMDALPDAGLITVDAKGALISMSNSLKPLHSTHSFPTSVGMSMEEVLAEPIYKQLAPLYQKALTDGTTYGKIQAEGILYNAQLSSVSDEFSQPLAVFIFLRDATELKDEHQKVESFSEAYEKINLERSAQKEKLQNLERTIYRLRTRIAVESEQMRGILDSKELMLVKLDKGFHFLRANGNFKSYMEIADEEELKGSLFLWLNKVDQSRFLEIIKKLKAYPHYVFDLEVSLARGNRRKWAKWEVAAIRDEENNILSYQLLGQDLTKNKEIEQMLWSSNERFQLLAKATNDAVWDWNIVTNEVWWNKEFYHLLGFHKKIMPSIDDWMAQIHPEDQERVINSFQEALNNKKQVWNNEFRCRLFDGSYGYMYNRAYITLDESGNPLRMLGSMMDITQRKLAEEELLQIKKRYEIAVEAGKTGLWDYDIRSQNIYLDDNLFKLFGYNNREFYHKVNNWNNLIHPDDKASVEERMAAYLCKEIDSYENIHRKIDSEGKEKWVLSRGTAFWDDGVPVRMIGTDTDITDYKNMEEELQQAKEDLEQHINHKEEFFSVMSHEIRTPMNAVIGMAHLLIESKPTPEQAPLLKSLKFSADNLLMLINDILDYSKLQAGKLEFNQEDFELKGLLKNLKMTLQPLADEKGIDLHLNVGKDVPHWVKGDQARLSQMLNNLMGNAIKFTTEGSVSLSVDRTSNHQKQEIVVFEVKDTGVGIPKDSIQHIFTPFKQVSSQTSQKFGGTGLGLAIVKDLVEKQSGKIEVESEEGEGSLFRVTLSFGVSNNSVASSEDITGKTTEKYSLKGAKILYVEDVVPNQLLMKGFSYNWDIELDIASNGNEGLEKVKENTYDLILMDLQMPEMDGYETTREIRELGQKEIPIIALTAEVSERAKKQVLEAGMNDYFSKPINPDLLYKKLQHWLNPIEEDMHMLMLEPTEAQEEVSYNTIPIFEVCDVNFEAPDMIFSKEPSVYDDFLRITIDDFRRDKKSVIKAIEGHNSEAYSKVRHKLNGVLYTLKLDGIADFLLRLKPYIRQDQRPFDEKKAIHAIGQQFELAISQLQHQQQKVFKTKEKV